MTTEPFPDLLVSEARTRHYVDGEMITARRGINWPAGVTVTDDPIEEKVDLSGLGGGVAGEFASNSGSLFFSGTDWSVSLSGAVAAVALDTLLIGFSYNLVTAETDNAYVAFQFDVDGTPSTSTTFAEGDPNDGVGVVPWLCTGSGNVGGALAWVVTADDLFGGFASIDFLTATDGNDRTADSSSFYILNLGAFT